QLGKRGCAVTALVPSAPGAARCEQVDNTEVLRYRYFFRSMETLAYGSGILENIRSNKARLFLIPFFVFGQIVALVHLLRRRQWDVIHAHWIIPQGLLAILAMILSRRKVPVCVTSHGGDLFAIKGRLGRALKRWVLSRADGVTVVSSAMARYITDELRVVPKQLAVLSMGVDLQDTFTPDTAVVRKPQQLIFVGRLAEKKGVSFLLQAIAELISEFPGLHLLLVGDGALREQLEARVRQLNITQHVEFLGAVENHRIPRFLQASAIAVVPSVVAGDGDQEGLGLVAVEALGCGCAVVASSLPAIKDVIRHEQTGLLAAPADPRNLADKIRRLLRDQTLRQDLAERGGEFVRSRFDWSVVGDDYHRLLTDLALSGTGKP
ncbi:MAG: glycosyltransferase, partial [Ketobacteraceae bacterium]|nr:glycosyltransferase [Ketobacteraceae bacterium]